MFIFIIIYIGLETKDLGNYSIQSYKKTKKNNNKNMTPALDQQIKYNHKMQDIAIEYFDEERGLSISINKGCFDCTHGCPSCSSMDIW